MRADWRRLAIAAASAATLAHAQSAAPPFVAASPGLAAEAGRADPEGGFGRRKTYSRIEVLGATVFTQAELQRLLEPFTGRALSAADVEAARRTLTRYYVDRGYVNSGATVAQGADPSVLTLRVTEGRLTRLQVKGLGRLDEDYLKARLVPSWDAPLNVDRLRDRFQLLLSDPLFDKLNARVLPGRGVGEAILDVEVTRGRPYALAVFADNYRPPSIGSRVAGVSGAFYNALGRGDVAEASVQGGKAGRDSLRGTFGYGFPVTFRGTWATVQYDRGRSSVIEEPLSDLDIRSRITVLDAGLSQVLLETPGTKVTIGFAHSERDSRTWLLGFPFSFVAGERDGVTRSHGERAWFEAALRGESQAFGTRLGYNRVRDNLEPIARLAAVQPDRAYAFWQLQAQHSVRLPFDDSMIASRALFQGTRDGLLPLDGVPIGGVASVRGYRENQFIRDKAALASVQWDRFVLGNADSRHSVQAGIFYDYGRGRGRAAPPVTLSSVGVATNVRIAGDFVARVAWGHRLSHPSAVDGLHGDLQDHGVHLYLGYEVFGRSGKR